jgi:hypothetical protein
MKHPQSKSLGCRGPWQRTTGMVSGVNSGMSLPGFSTRQRPGTERGFSAAYNNTMGSTLHMRLIVYKLIAKARLVGLAWGTMSSWPTLWHSYAP